MPSVVVTSYPGGNYIAPPIIWANATESLIVASDGAADDHFGLSLVTESASAGAVFLTRNGQYLFVGASTNDLVQSNVGRGYVYEKLLGVWTFKQFLDVPPTPVGNEIFGSTISASSDGTHVLIGGGEQFWYFENVAGTWVFRQNITDPAAPGSHNFGISVDISDDGLIGLVGAYAHDITGTNNEGRLYSFARNIVSPSAEFQTDFDGIDGQTTLTEQSSNGAVATLVNFAQLDTAQSKFGPSSLILNGSSDYVIFPDLPAYNLAASDFTIESQIRLNSQPSASAHSGMCMMSHYRNTTNDRSWFWSIETNNTIRFFGSNDGVSVNVNVVSSVLTWNLNQWYHLVVERVGSTITLYRDGVSVGSLAAGTFNAFDAPDLLYVGLVNSNVGFQRYFDGWMDEMRMVIGTSVYGAPFTPPTVPFSAAWTLDQIIDPPNLLTNGRFGGQFALAPDGTHLIVGQPEQSATSGRVYAYDRAGGVGSWTFNHELVNSFSQTNLRFGRGCPAFTADGNTVIVGAAQKHQLGGGLNFVGAALVYKRVGGQWAEAQVLQGSSPQGSDLFGDLASIGISNDGGTLTVGAFNQDAGKGAMYVYTELPTVADTDWASVTLLFSGDGADESTVFTDLSDIGHTLSNFGTAKIDTTTDPYADGLGTYEQFGAGDYLSTPYVFADFDWFASDYTIDAWVYASSWADWQSPTNFIPLMVGNTDADNVSQWWNFGPLASGAIEFYYWNGVQNRVTGTTVLATSTWNHISMTHRVSDGQIDLYVNGVLDTTAIKLGIPQSNNVLGALHIGAANNGGFTGRVADLRITQGVRRHTGNFAPPIRRYARSASETIDAYVENTRIVSATGDVGESFGRDTMLRNNTEFFVGAGLRNSPASDQGAVYVYEL